MNIKTQKIRKYGTIQRSKVDSLESVTDDEICNEYEKCKNARKEVK